MLAGFFRTVATVVAVWFIWRWLDRNVGGRPASRHGERGRTRPAEGGGKPRRPDDSHEGEYVDFEELKD